MVFVSINRGCITLSLSSLIPLDPSLSLSARPSAVLSPAASSSRPPPPPSTPFSLSLTPSSLPPPTCRLTPTSSSNKQLKLDTRPPEPPPDAAAAAVAQAVITSGRHAAELLLPELADRAPPSPRPPCTTTFARTTQEAVEPRGDAGKTFLKLTRNFTENSSGLPSPARFFADRRRDRNPTTHNNSFIYRLPPLAIEKPKYLLDLPSQRPQYPSAANVKFPT